MFVRHGDLVFAAGRIKPAELALHGLVLAIGPHIRGAQTGVFELDIRISNPPYIHRSKSLAAETGRKSRNVEKRINAV
jgi:hypothetical protein